MKAEVSSIKTVAGKFDCAIDDERVAAMTVLIAAGIRDNHLPMPDWYGAVLAGAIRLCPICDGYDVIDQNISTVATSRTGLGHALFLRTYSPRVTVIEDGIAPVCREGERQVCVECCGGQSYLFDVLYPMVGDVARSGLATALGIACTDDGQIVVDRHQRSNVAGLYAAGDVVDGLNQIAVATGYAAIAAIAIPNYLPEILDNEMAGDVRFDKRDANRSTRLTT